MKVQLVSAPLKDSGGFDEWYMPLGLLSLANSLNGVSEVEILDGTQMNLEEILGRTEGDLVGITYTTLSVANVRPIAQQAKSNGGFVIVGGQAATVDPGLLLQMPEIDAVVVYDGEPTLRTLVQNRLSNLDAVPNLVYRANGSLKKTTPKRIQLDQYYKTLDRNIGGLNIEDYIRSFPESNTLINIEAKRPTNIFSQRGCWRTCSFCARQDKGYRTRDPKNVVKEIRELRERHGVDYVVDCSDTWAKKQWVDAFRKAYDSSLDTRMMVFANVTDIDEEIARKMAEVNVDNVLYGVESGSERILRTNGKLFTREDVLRAAGLATQRGIKVSASFVLGLLGEDERSLEETYSLIEELGEIKGVRAYANVLIPLPGSPLWKNFMGDPRMMVKYSKRGLDYNLEETRKDFLATCTDVDLPPLMELRDQINSRFGLRALEYAR